MLKTYLGILILVTVVTGIGCNRETSPRTVTLSPLADCGWRVVGLRNEESPPAVCRATGY